MYLKQCEVDSRVEYFKGDIQEIIKSKKTIKKWAYISHNECFFCVIIKGISSEPL